MNDAAHREQPEVWRPMTGMPPGAHAWQVPGYRELAEEWASIRARLKGRDEPRAFLDGWLAERGRAFAIETGRSRASTRSSAASPNSSSRKG